MLATPREALDNAASHAGVSVVGATSKLLHLFFQLSP
jgi:hypothetical protein